MPAETRVITAHVPLGLADKVEAMATRLERSRGWVMKQALAAWVDQEEERHRLTLLALDDVEAGRVIDAAAIQAWAQSLSTDSPQSLPSTSPPAA
jgi:predicted transcriptional regulator